MAVRVPPVVVGLKTDATPIGVLQYPMSREARDGIRPHIQRLLHIFRDYFLAWGAASVANPGIQSLQNPAVPKNSLTCLGVASVGI